MFRATRQRIACWLSCLLVFVALSQAWAINEDLKLPDLGTGGSGVFSPQQEHELGRAWLMSFRRQAPIIHDPLLTDYLESLVFNLATFSQLKDRRIELVVVDNASMNAFAVPGGVMGIHNGMLVNAKTEDQLASVISHELAHVSQHHFARRVEQQQKAYLPTMAGMLAGLVLVAAGSGDAGMAAITGTQAAALQAQLAYSRQNEQEADRVGMRTMVEAGMDPNAVGDMFEEMQRASRLYSTRPPEFLMTHPVTQSRIADARNRAANYDTPPRDVDIEYRLMQARVKLHFEKSPREAVIRFRTELSNALGETYASRYGLAMALIKERQLEEAGKLIDEMLAEEPDRITYQVLKADWLIAGNELEQAEALIKQQLQYNPNNHPLTMTYFKALRRGNKNREAEIVLTTHTSIRPNDPNVWYELAEVRGLAGNIIGVHEARAEYFYLSGSPDLAIKQLGYALPMVRDDYPSQVKLQQRIRDIQQWKENMKF